MVKYIIFDIDGTLIDESSVLEAQTSAVAWKFGESLAAKQMVVDQFFVANNRAVLEGGQQKNNIVQYMLWIGEALDISISDTEAEKLAHDWSQAFATTFSIPKVFPDTVSCLEALQAEGRVLIAASGGTKEKKLGLLSEAGLAAYFSSIYTATDVGFQKQDRRFWDFVLADLAVSPEQCLVVGNQTNDDIMQPKALGMYTVLVKRPGLLRKDLGPRDISADNTISNLSEVLTFL
jgi:FMN phosphatase YigB (HAD superfamily)